MFSYAKIYLLPNTKMLVFEVPQAITSLTFLIPMSRVMLGLHILGVKGLVWLWQMRNPINEVLNSIQDIISTELKRTNTPTCCATESKLWEEPPLNNSLLQQMDLQGRSIHATAMTRTALFLWQRQVVFHFPAPSTLSPQTAWPNLLLT